MDTRSFSKIALFVKPDFESRNIAALQYNAISLNHMVKSSEIGLYHIPNWFDEFLTELLAIFIW